MNQTGLKPLHIEEYYSKEFLGTHSIINLATLKAMSDNSEDSIAIDRLLNSELEYEDVIREAKRVLKSGGVLYITLASISLPVVPEERLFGFTIASAKYIFSKHFGEQNIKIENYGNALVGRKILENVTADKIEKSKLDYKDEFFPIIVGVKAVKE